MDKLTVINNALISSGNNPLNVLNDGSDEWTAANTAFGRAITFLIARHNWPFAVSIVELARADDSLNQSRRYPQNCFQLPGHYHLIDVIHCKDVTNQFDLIGSLVSSCHDDEMFAKIVTLPPDASWHPMATEILTLMVESGCYRSLNEDFPEAKARWADAENLLAETRTRVDQENPNRNAFKSKIALARRRRYR